MPARIRIFLILFVALSTLIPKPISAAAPETDRPFGDCSSTREYVTTLEFLRSERAVAVSDVEARKIAAKVAHGCTDAARRFISVTTMLTRASLAPVDAVRLGIGFSNDTDQVTDTFIRIFASAYAEDGLDLDAGSALEMARKLSTEFKGDQQRVREDFVRLVEFCASREGLDLSRPQCGRMAARLAARGEGFGGGVAAPFLEVFDFLTSKRGPGLTTGDALNTAETLIGYGSRAAENFIQAYRYGRSDSGLKLDHFQAIDFGMKMAALSEPGNSERK